MCTSNVFIYNNQYQNQNQYIYLYLYFHHVAISLSLCRYRCEAICLFSSMQHFILIVKLVTSQQKKSNLLLDLYEKLYVFCSGGTNQNSTNLTVMTNWNKFDSTNIPIVNISTSDTYPKYYLCKSVIWWTFWHIFFTTKRAGFADIIYFYKNHFWQGSISQTNVLSQSRFDWKFVLLILFPIKLSHQILHLTRRVLSW